jgi:dockerin type I repeat protein
MKTLSIILAIAITFILISGIIPHAGTTTEQISVLRSSPRVHILGPPAADFSLSANPNDLAVAQASSTSSSIIVNSLGGFAGTVTLSATTTPSSGPALSLSPSSVSVTAGCSCSSALTITTIQTTPPGLYNVTVTGTSGSLSHSTLLQAAVTPITWTINDNENFTGVNVRTTGSLTLDSPSNVFTLSGTPTVTATNATTHASLFTQTYTITKQPLNYPSEGGYQALFILNIAVSPYTLGLHLIEGLTGPTSTAPGSSENYMFVYRNADVNGDGFVTNIDFNLVRNNYGCSVGQPCYNGAADLNGNGIGDIIDVSVEVRFGGATNYGVASYGVSPSANSITVLAGGSSTATITLASLFNYAGTIGLTTTVSPSGPTASLNPTSVTVNAGGSSTSTLTVSAGSSTAIGFYTMSVNATSGSRTHTINLSIDVVDFTLSANPSHFTVHNGNSGNSTISVLPLNGFTGTVSLTASVTPGSTGPFVSISPSSVTVSGCGATSTLTFNARGTTGLYNVTITGTSGSISHSITLQVVDTPLSFSISNTQIFTGVNVTTTGSLSIDYPANAITASGTVTVVAINATTHISLFSKTYTISHLALSTPYQGGFQTKFLVNVAVNPYSLATYIILNLGGPTSTAPGAANVPTPMVARNADINADRTVDLADYNTVVASYGCSTGQTCFNPKADLDADGTVTITDVSIANYYFGSPNYI